MRRWKSSFTLILLTAGFCWVLFTSLSPQKYSYSVTGQVEALAGSVVNAKVKYSQKEKDTDFESMKSFDVRANGTFSAVINLEAQGKVYFYLTKDRYTTVQYEKLVTELDAPNDLGTLKFSSLHKELSYEQQANPDLGPFLLLHHDRELKSIDHKVNVSDILYFTEIEEVLELGETVSSAHLTLSAKVNYLGKKNRKRAYFSLQQHANGEAFIAENYSRSDESYSKNTHLASRNKD
jgi:hypothetical protein